MTILDKILPESKNRKWISVALTVLIAIVLTVWGIYVIEEYGFALFVLTPVFIGAGATFFYGYKREINLTQAWGVSFLSLGIFALGLFLCAMEGVICILMAAPIGMLLTFLGSVITYHLMRRTPKSAPTAPPGSDRPHSFDGICGKRPKPRSCIRNHFH